MREIYKDKEFKLRKRKDLKLVGITDSLNMEELEFSLSQATLLVCDHQRAQFLYLKSIRQISQSPIKVELVPSLPKVNLIRAS